MQFTPAAPIIEAVTSTSIQVTDLHLDPVSKTVTLTINRLDAGNNRMSSQKVTLSGPQAVAFMNVQIAGVTLAQVATGYEPVGRSNLLHSHTPRHR